MRLLYEQPLRLWKSLKRSAGSKKRPAVKPKKRLLLRRLRKSASKQKSVPRLKRKLSRYRQRWKNNLPFAQRLSLPKLRNRPSLRPKRKLKPDAVGNSLRTS